MTRVVRGPLLVELGLVAVPAVALLVATASGPEGVEGRFHGALAGLVVITTVGAFSSGNTSIGVRSSCQPA